MGNIFQQVNLVSGYPEDSINHPKHKDHGKPGFMVRAVKPGYYGLCMRQPGDVFKIQYARHFADHKDKALNGLGWMEKADGPLLRNRKHSSDSEGRGARPASEDPSERAARVAESDRMALEAAREDQGSAEAEVI
jgi:hypothetical protein